MRLAAVLFVVTTGAVTAVAAGAAENPLAGLDAAALPDLVGRPPFSPTRTPPAGPEPEAEYVAPPEPEPEPPTDVLVGVVIAGGRSVALLADASGGAARSVGAGDDVGGWTVEEVAPDRVVLALGDRRETLRLFDPARAGAAPPPPREAGLDDEDDDFSPRPRGAAAATGDMSELDGEQLLEAIRRRARERR